MNRPRYASDREYLDQVADQIRASLARREWLGPDRHAPLVGLQGGARSYPAVRPDDTHDQSLFLSKFKRGIGPRSIKLPVAKYLKEAGVLA